jgi:DNA repair exonuclease SbcCD nuclease subunit
MKSIKLLLTSDLHLGIDKKGYLNLWNERVETFRRIMIQAAKHDILLIAGDFFDRELEKALFFEYAAPEFTTLIENGTEIFFTPGPGDLNTDIVIMDYISGLDKCYYFSDQTVDDYIKSGKGDLYIYGLQANSKHSPESISRCSKKGFHLGLFYADYNPGSRELFSKDCIDRESMKNMNMDFYALGKSHTFKMFKSQNKILGASPGSPEPCSIDEYGDRFVISIEINNSSISNIKRIPVNTGAIKSCEINCSVFENENELIEKIKTFSPENKIFNITLTGTRFFEFKNLENELNGFFKGLQITNRTTPSLNIQILTCCGDNSLMGEIYRTLEKIIEEKNIPENINHEALARVLHFRFSSPLNREEVIFCDL